METMSNNGGSLSQNHRGVTWRARWRFTTVRQCVQRRKSHWARKSSLGVVRRICDAFIRKNVVANIYKNCTILIHGDIPTTSCKYCRSLARRVIIVRMETRRRHLDQLTTRNIHFIRIRSIVRAGQWIHSTFIGTSIFMYSESSFTVSMHNVRCSFVVIISRLLYTKHDSSDSSLHRVLNDRKWQMPQPSVTETLYTYSCPEH